MPLIDYEKQYKTVTAGLENYTGRPIIRANQNQEPPQYPYMTYTITRLLSENKGTYGIYEDGTRRKPFTQTWSISAVADTHFDSVMLAVKAREWLDCYGASYLNDNGVIVQSVGGITNRDNLLTTEYEYRNGFDVVFYLFDTIEGIAEYDGEITDTSINVERDNL